MSYEVKVPVLPESVADATVAKWYKKVGDTVAREENIVDLETDKIMLEVPAPCSGVLTAINVEEGAVVNAKQLIAVIEEGAVAEVTANNTVAAAVSSSAESSPATSGTQPLSPSARREVKGTGVNPDQVQGTGPGGRVTKQDVRNHASAPAASSAAEAVVESSGSRTEKRVPMSRLRQRVAERLVQVQHEAAILTTFNEVNMKPVMDLRKAYKDKFEKVHGVKLGFMSFFTAAVVEALKRYPAVNSSIDGNEIIYHNYCDVGVAIGSERGLVVPIIRNAETLSMADIEQSIRNYAAKASTGKLALEDMTGGTFTITNGGTFGSMLSTPIINPPQTGILGMHNIVKRPCVIDDEIVIRPMMYLALSYDHRVVDGREAVLFLVTIKELLEDPARMLLAV